MLHRFKMTGDAILSLKVSYGLSRAYCGVSEGAPNLEVVALRAIR